MKNTDYLIHITTKHGRKWRYLKEGSDWTQTAPTGIVRRLSAEQLLSHLLPPLAADQPWLSVRVVRKNRQEHASSSLSPGGLEPRTGQKKRVRRPDSD
jgi:hypothetical protein